MLEVLLNETLAVSPTSTQNVVAGEIKHEQMQMYNNKNGGGNVGTSFPH